MVMNKSMSKSREEAEVKSEGFQLYEMGKSYNHRMEPDYYAMVKENERMTYGNQWEGVISKGLPTPQFNILRRILTYFTAFLTSSPLKVNYTPMNISENTKEQKEINVLKAVEKLNTIAMAHWESNDMDDLLREAITDAGVTGDAGAYVYWDDDIDTGNDVKGDFVTKLVDGVNIMFGNPNDRTINRNGKGVQPWILMLGRDMVQNLIEEAKANNLPTSGIGPDSDYEYQAGERGDIELDYNSAISGKAQYFVKFFPKKNETGETTIHFCKYTRGATIQEVTDTKLKIYPIAWMNWEKRKNSYHGQALITNVIPNQIFINKMMALVMVHQMSLAFGKIVYDKSLVSSWNNSVMGAVGIDGQQGAIDLRQVAVMLKGADLPSNIVSIIELTIKMTTESLGANDVLLGNVNPENTSAIIQVTEQASVPLLSQKTAIYKFVEQLAEIWYNYIKNYYGNVERTITYTDENGKQEVAKFNPMDLLDTLVRPKIDVGPSNWWNENDVIKTLDILYDRRIINVVQYLKRMPADRIPDKDKLIEEFEAMRQGFEADNQRDENGVLINAGGMSEPVADENQPTNEQLDTFFKTLPQDMQTELRMLPDMELENALLELFNKPELLEKVGL